LSVAAGCCCARALGAAAVAMTAVRTAALNVLDKGFMRDVSCRCAADSINLLVE
jgi:hypothetical protein